MFCLCLLQSLRRKSTAASFMLDIETCFGVLGDQAASSDAAQESLEKKHDGVLQTDSSTDFSILADTQCQ